MSGHQSESEKSLGKLAWLSPEVHVEATRERHPAWLIPSGLLSTLGRAHSALPTLVRGIRLLASMDRASDLEAGPRAELLTTPSSAPLPILLFSKQGWGPPEGQKLPQRVSKMVSPMTPAVDCKWFLNLVVSAALSATLPGQEMKP